MASRLEQQGLLTHTREQCPWRNGPAVREWTPAHGWRDYATEP
jgi:ribosome modulation factor